LTVETYDYSIINEKKTSYNSPLYSRSAFPNSVVRRALINLNLDNLLKEI
jgi:hypothetical protein